MKLRMYLTMLAVSLLSYTMQSCDDDDDDSKNVSEQLENAFTKTFGNVEHKWSVRGTNHVAEFKQNNQEKEAWYDVNGVWLMTETDITYNALPAEVKTAFEAIKKYEGYERDDIDMLERKGMETVYVIEVEKGNEEYDLYFDAKGNLLKEVADKDDDSVDYLPTTLPDAITKILNEKYTGYKLLEAELDKTTNILEVDIMLQTTKLEVCFSNNTWILTTKEVLFNTLPERVKEAANTASQKHPGAELDDEADEVDTPQGKYYTVEIEIEGKPSIEIKINEDGTLKQ